MIIHNFSELLINVAYDLNKNNATLELNFMEMDEFIDKYLIIHLDILSYEAHQSDIINTLFLNIDECSNIFYKENQTHLKSQIFEKVFFLKLH